MADSVVLNLEAICFRVSFNWTTYVTKFTVPKGAEVIGQEQLIGTARLSPAFNA